MLSNLAETVAKYSPAMANKIEALDERLHFQMGYERKIVIGEHKVYTKFKKRGHTGKYSGNSDFYANGEIYFKGKANPIEISPTEAEENHDINLVASDKYRNAVRNKIVSQALNTPTDEYDLAEKLLMALVGLVVLGITAGAMVYMG